MLDEHKNLSQYGSYATASEIMPYYSHPGGLVGRQSIPNAPIPSELMPNEC